jgi:hypothetical protein
VLVHEMRSQDKSIILQHQQDHHHHHFHFKPFPASGRQQGRAGREGVKSEEEHLLLLDWKQYKATS